MTDTGLTTVTHVDRVTDGLRALTDLVGQLPLGTSLVSVDVSLAEDKLRVHIAGGAMFAKPAADALGFDGPTVTPHHGTDSRHSVWTGWFGGWSVRLSAIDHARADRRPRC
jgi:hypothetical protein